MNQTLKAKDMQLLFEGAKLELIEKDEILYSSDQPARLRVIMSGFVKRYFIAHDGSLGVQAIYGPDDIFPLTIVFKELFDQEIYQGPEVYYYQAMTSLRVYTIDGSTLSQKAKLYPELHRILLENAGKRFHSNIQFLENLRLHGAYAKTAHQLAYFGHRFGKQADEGLRIQLPLTHQDIADIIGTTRETVTASIIKLRDRKLIQTDRNILILDFNQLLTEAYS
jgi:CRP/FNR family transcriptional regulator